MCGGRNELAYARVQKSVPWRTIYPTVTPGGGVQIGNNCSIDKTAIFGSEPYLIKIGDNVRITHGVKFITHDGGLWVPRNMRLIDVNADLIAPIVIGNNVNIGWDAIIMPGVKIGDNSIIGCGAVVTKSIPNNSVAIGVPARVIETVEEYADKNHDRYISIKNFDQTSKRKYLLEHFKL